MTTLVIEVGENNCRISEKGFACPFLLKLLNKIFIA